MRRYFKSAFLPFLLLPMLESGTHAQDQYFTDESSARLPDTVIWSRGADAGDIDGDGDWDLCVATARVWGSFGPNYLLINDGLGYFTEESEIRLPEDATEASNCVFGDIELDGDLDIYVCNYGTGMYGEDNLYVNDGNGIFEDQTAERIPPHENVTKVAAFADFTEDFSLDIFVQASWHYYPGTRLLENDGFGFFADVTQDRLPPDSFDNMYIAVGDIDNDLDLDVVESCFDTEYPYFWARLLKNLGGGYFSDSYQNQLPLRRLRYIVMGDIDIDGDLDIVTSIGSQLCIWVNDGTGFYNDESDDMLPRGEDLGGSHLALGDYDNDGDLDLFVGEAELRPAHFFVNEGDGFFSVADDRLPGNNRQSVFWVESFDIDADGDLDLFLACFGDGRQKIFINHSTPDTIPPAILTGTVLTGSIDSLGAFPIRVSAWDNISVAIGELTGVLYYRLNGRDFIEVELLPLGGTFFGERIPGQPVGTRVDYYMELTDRMGNATLLPPNAPDSTYSFVVGQSTDVDDNTGLAIASEIITVSPNPFNLSTTIRYALKSQSHLTLEIYDLLGRKVACLYEGLQQPGHHRLTWHASDLPSGIYFARLRAGAMSTSVKMVLLK